MKKSNLKNPLRAKQHAPTPVIGVTWYTAENWQRVKAAAVDPDLFEATYAQWCTMVEDAIADMKKAGVNPVRVFVHAEQLLTWSLVHNKPINAASRSEYVVHVQQLQDEAGA